MSQTLNPLFLQPTGYVSAPAVRIRTVGVFAQQQKDDLDLVFFQAGHGDWSIDITYHHLNIGDPFTMPVTDETETIRQDMGEAGGYYTVKLVAFKCHTADLLAIPERGDMVIMEGIDYTVDGFEESFGITKIYLKVYS